MILSRCTLHDETQSSLARSRRGDRRTCRGCRGAMLLSALRRCDGGFWIGRAWWLRDHRPLSVSGIRVAFSSWSRTGFPPAPAHRSPPLRLRERRALGLHFLRFISDRCALRRFVRLTGCHGLELPLFATPSSHLADLAIDHYLPAVWAPRRGDNADERLSFFLRLPCLPRAPQACARRLLCILQLWLRSVPTYSDRCAMLCLNSGWNWGSG